MARDPRALALAYLAGHQVMTLATFGPLGLWAAAVFYVNDGFDLYFLSAAHTRHAQNLATRPGVAATIQEDYRDWEAIQGIQLAGVVQLLDGPGRAAAIRHYKAKYPFINRSAQLAAALTHIGWYRLQPTQLYFIDNSQGLGHRDQITLDD